MQTTKRKKRNLGFRKSIIVTKVLPLSVLAVMCWVATCSVGGVVSDRSEQATYAEQRIKESWAPVLNGMNPVLVLGERRTREIEKTLKNEKGKFYTERQEEVYVVDSTLLSHVADTQIIIDVEKRQLGLFLQPVYTAQINVTGEIEMPDIEGELYKLKLHLPLSSIEGLQIANVAVNNNSMSVATDAVGLVSDITFEEARHKTIEYAISLVVRGSERIAWDPIGKEGQLEISGNWPHPSFAGQGLPSSRKVTSELFSASWQSSILSTTLQMKSEMSVATLLSSSRMFGVGLQNGVDVYTKFYRVVEYGILLILVLFCTLFGFEVVMKERLHLMNYLLMGVSLVVFLLLVVSCSEHVGFTTAYGGAAFALCALNGFYASGFIEQRRNRFGLIVALGGSMAAIFGVVNSEDHALLSGSLLLFALLSVVMIATRKLKWDELAIAGVSDEAHNGLVTSVAMPGLALDASKTRLEESP